MKAYPDWLSLREIDLQAGTPKGSAFRAFKAMEGQLQEGHDYCVLDASQHRDDIATLRRTGRIYPSSVQVLLLSQAAAARIAVALRSAPAARR